MTNQKHTVIAYNKITDRSGEDMKDILEQVAWAEEILTGLGYTVERIAFDLSEPGLLKRLQEKDPAFVFNLVEAGRGEESLAYLAGALFPLLGLKYTGCSVDAILTTTNKVLSKIMMKRAGITTPGWVHADDCRDFVPGCKYIVKPVREDASVGIYQSSVVLAHDLKQLLGTMADRERNEGFEFFAERYVEGREFDVMLLSGQDGAEALPPLELIFNGFQENRLEPLFSYQGKWGGNPLEYDNVELVVAEDGELSETMRQIARDCWNLFQLSGYGKVDFRVDESGQPHVLEINANPSFYGFSRYEKAGHLTMREVFQRIVTAALERKV